MKYLLTLLTLLLFCDCGYATGYIGLGVEGRFVKNVEDNYEIETPFLIYGGYRTVPWAFAIEAQKYKNSSAISGLYSVDVTHYESSIYFLRFLDYQSARILNPYIMAGYGLMREDITTKLFTQTDKDKSKIYSIGKLGAGLWSTIHQTVFFNIEGKGMVSDGYTPKLLFSLSLRLGLEF